MEKIFEIIKEYDIEMESITRDGDSLFKCTGRQSKVIFYLDTNFKVSKVFKAYEDIDESVVYIVIIENDIDDILTKLNEFDEKKGHILVYDPNEDIEFFSKDFWNLYITLTK